MTEAMPFLQKHDITFLRPPTIGPEVFFSQCLLWGWETGSLLGGGDAPAGNALRTGAAAPLALPLGELAAISRLRG